MHYIPLQIPTIPYESPVTILEPVGLKTIIEILLLSLCTVLGPSS